MLSLFGPSITEKIKKSIENKDIDTFKTFTKTELEQFSPSNWSRERVFNTLSENKSSSEFYEELFKKGIMIDSQSINTLLFNGSIEKAEIYLKNGYDLNNQLIDDTVYKYFRKHDQFKYPLEQYAKSLKFLSINGYVLLNMQNTHIFIMEKQYSVLKTCMKNGLATIENFLEYLKTHDHDVNIVSMFMKYCPKLSDEIIKFPVVQQFLTTQKVNNYEKGTREMVKNEINDFKLEFNKLVYCPEGIGAQALFLKKKIEFLEEENKFFRREFENLKNEIENLKNEIEKSKK